MSEQEHTPLEVVKAEPSAMVPAAVTMEPSPQSFTAENADEMAQCQNGLIQWCKAKVWEVRQEAAELQAAFDHAVKQKWSNATLKRHSALALKRLDFYERMLTALEHGYQIVPSFPITAFAIRTDRKKPLKMWSTSHYKQHTQKSEGLPSGEGEYKNPFPVVMQRTIAKATTTTSPSSQNGKGVWIAN